MELDKIIQHAKDHILKHGNHLSEILVELEGEEVYILAVPDIVNEETTYEKQKNFFTTGIMIGEKHRNKDICQVIFIVEAWMSQASEDGSRKYDQPSQDPNRKECLIINTLDIVPKEDGSHIEQGMNMVEIIRDGAGNLIDLLQWKLPEQGKSHSPLLIAFLAGYSSTKLSKEQKMAMIAQTMGPDATGEDTQRLYKDVYETKRPYMYHVTPTNIPRRTAHTKKHKKKRRIY